MKHGARLFYAIAATLAAVIAGACSADSTDDLALGGPGVSPGGSSGGSGSDLGVGVPVEPPPEKEVDGAFRVPVVSGHWVWTANPTSGRVALIDAQTFTVKTALAGAGPTYLAALPAEGGGSRALVINSVSLDVTLLTANEAGEIETTATLPVHEGANAWAVSPDGRFAIAWTNASAVANADASDGFQDITVLGLAGKTFTSKRLSVGYRPARVFMDDDSLSAYVATDSGIDVVDLAGKAGAIVDSEIELSLDPANDTAPRDVNMTADGRYAFVSRQGKDYVTVVDIAQRMFRDVTLPGIVTDLDLSADGSTAVAIIRERSAMPVATSAAGGEGGQTQTTGGTGGGAGVENGAGGLDIGAGGGLGGGGASEAGEGPGPAPQPVSGSLAMLLPVDTIFDAPDDYVAIALEEVFGSVDLGANDGQTALLYSNGIPSTHLTLLGLAGGAGAQHRTVDLKLPIFSALSTPDGAHAIALLKPPVGSRQPGAFAVVPVAKDLPAKIQGTLAVTVPTDLSQATPAMVAIDDERALVTVTDGVGVSVAYLVSMPELTVDAFPLDSVPLAQSSGLVPEAKQAFVAQKHPEGRITFIDLESHELHTLTGFELATRVGQ